MLLMIESSIRIGECYSLLQYAKASKKHLESYY